LTFNRFCFILGITLKLEIIMYYIYHIPGVKIGCTGNLKRRLRQQGYKLSQVEVIAIIEDINQAADLEKELNLKYGYSWNNAQDYRNMIKVANLALQTDYKRYNHNFTKDERVLGGKISGRKNVENGHLAKVRDVKKAGLASCLKEYTCPHCGKVGKSNSMFGHHFDKCKYKP
jgi:hypothetical protein